MKKFRYIFFPLISLLLNFLNFSNVSNSECKHLASPRHEQRESRLRKEEKFIFIFSKFTAVVNMFLEEEAQIPHTSSRRTIMREIFTVNCTLTLPPARQHIAVVTQNHLFCARPLSVVLLYCD